MEDLFLFIQDKTAEMHKTTTYDRTHSQNVARLLQVTFLDLLHTSQGKISKTVSVSCTTEFAVKYDIGYENVSQIYKNVKIKTNAFL